MKYIATFTPQAWINDYAVEVDAQGDTTFDVTPEIAKMGKVPPDDDKDSDDLQYAAAAPQWIKDWSGPFYITIEEKSL